MNSYSEQLRRETAIYQDDEVVHDLPAAYHWWSQRYVLPKLRSLGVDNYDDFFTAPVIALAEARRGPLRLLSIGSGNGDLEVRLAQRLRAAGVKQFTVQLLEMNGAMQERARRAAVEAGVAAHIQHEEADFNTWVPYGPVDIALASHSLHHVTELEHLFDAVRDALADDGLFLVSDIIGRNGHLRWPEAADVVRRLWQVVPESWRYNHQFRTHHPHFDDWDCSGESFEGIRAQDILPLLLERFHPGLFLAYANVVDVFLDRGYGPNVDLDDPVQVELLRRIAELDETLLDLGLVTPTHLVATFHPQPVEARWVGDRSPTRSVRLAREMDPSGQAVVPRPDAAGAVVSGGLIALSALHGRHPDAWAGPSVEVDLLAVQDLGEVVVTGHVSDRTPELALAAHVDGERVQVAPLRTGPFRVEVPVTRAAGGSLRLRLAADRSFSPADSGGEDTRSLAYLLHAVTAGHAAGAVAPLAEADVPATVDAAQARAQLLRRSSHAGGELLRRLRTRSDR